MHYTFSLLYMYSYLHIHANQFKTIVGVGEKPCSIRDGLGLLQRPLFSSSLHLHACTGEFTPQRGWKNGGSIPRSCAETSFSQFCSGFHISLQSGRWTRHRHAKKDREAKFRELARGARDSQGTGSRNLASLCYMIFPLRRSVAQRARFVKRIKGEERAQMQ